MTIFHNMAFLYRFPRNIAVEESYPGKRRRCCCTKKDCTKKEGEREKRERTLRARKTTLRVEREKIKSFE